MKPGIGNHGRPRAIYHTAVERGNPPVSETTLRKVKRGRAGRSDEWPLLFFSRRLAGQPAPDARQLRVSARQ